MTHHNRYFSVAEIWGKQDVDDLRSWIYLLSTIRFVKKLGRATQSYRADGLEWVLFRVGVLGGLRSVACGSRAVGLMITASHNPLCDNGVKLIDPLGEMLEAVWEKYATKIVQASDADLTNCIAEIVGAEDLSGKMSDETRRSKAVVYGGYDTRPSSVSLHSAAQAGVQALGVLFKTFGLLTTPMLHYIVRAANCPEEGYAPTVDGYYDKLLTAFQLFSKEQTVDDENGGQDKKKNYVGEVYVDCANGVGGPKMNELIERLKKSAASCLTINLINIGEDGELNHQCGADFVKMKQCAPIGITLQPGQRWVSFDGDADRIVYYFVNQVGKFVLMDGDKMAVLIAGYLGELLKEKNNGLENVVHLGVVQTAYANGASTKYLTDQMKVDVKCTPTGVKHLHAAALTLDMGVYFEANGHGTVLLNDRQLSDEQISTLKGFELKQKGLRYISLQNQKLKQLFGIINETVGDAISDLLLVESILRVKNMSIEQWAEAYMDLPNRQLKVPVPNRYAIVTKNAEREVEKPEELQTAIDKIIKDSGIPVARSFVRPSGTENVVRVYAESDTQESTDSIAEAVKQAVIDIVKE